jgi:putative DNA primase/helicase
MEGLTPPASVLAATEEYFAEEDPTQRWIGEACEQKDSASALVVDLFHSWEEWASAQNEFVGSIKRFSQILQTKNYRRSRSGAGGRAVTFHGLKPITQEIKL